jgi:hypothetical protein
MDRIAAGPTGKDLGKCRFLLERLTPSLRQEYLARAAAENVPRQKARFMRLVDTFWGPDAVKFLMAELGRHEIGGIGRRLGTIDAALRYCA